ncbi:hypothetical protein [Chroococcidiopsis sp. CCMEE 29]|uniref:hypothetical protein n=1 Tax=Chroococcidiopsis sp. CCMEE 29 TaxID=155894 RepID=UPI00201FB43C|nr:hypothetical protein [Chroococcidiopsis sp. CCMEE 29]
MNYNSSLALISDRNLVATEFSSLCESSRFVPVEAAQGEILEPPTQKDRSKQSKPPTQEDRAEPLSQEEQHERHELELEIKQISSGAYYEVR